MDVKTFRDNLFQMNTRRFGKVAEILIKKTTGTNFSTNVHYDLNDSTDSIADTRIEVKFSRVEKKHRVAVEEGTVLDIIENEGLSVRLFPFGEWQLNDFDCNIQQVKKGEFDFLFYGLLFADRVVIFMAEAEDIGAEMRYSDKQHKGNEGEGQFHINPRTLQYHMENHHWLTLSYADTMKILQMS